MPRGFGNECAMGARRCWKVDRGVVAGPLEGPGSSVGGGRDMYKENEAWCDTAVHA